MNPLLRTCTNTDLLVGGWCKRQDGKKTLTLFSQYTLRHFLESKVGFYVFGSHLESNIRDCTGCKSRTADVILWLFQDRVWANVAKCLNCVIAMVDKVQEDDNSRQQSAPEQQRADVITSHNNTGKGLVTQRSSGKDGSVYGTVCLPCLTFNTMTTLILT